MQKFTTLLGSLLAGSFLIGLATTLTRSSMIVFLMFCQFTFWWLLLSLWCCTKLSLIKN